MSLLITEKATHPTRLSAADFLKQSPKGPYTSLVVRRKAAVLHWQSHIDRLHESLLLLEAEKNTFGDSISGMNKHAIADAVLPCVENAYGALQKGVLDAPDISVVVLLGASQGYAGFPQAANLHEVQVPSKHRA